MRIPKTRVCRGRRNVITLYNTEYDKHGVDRRLVIKPNKPLKRSIFYVYNNARALHNRIGFNNELGSTFIYTYKKNVVSDSS